MTALDCSCEISRFVYRPAGAPASVSSFSKAIAHCGTHAGMLDHQHVAGHQVRPGDARELVVGEVPGLDAEDHADRAALHMGLADGRDELRRAPGSARRSWRNRRGSRALNSTSPRASPMRLPISSVMVRAKASACSCSSVAALAMIDRPLGIAVLAPGLVTGLRRRQLGLEAASNVVEAPDHSSVEGVEALIGHGKSLPERNDLVPFL